ncbi:fungal-specific transcription factor domain-containing protein [Mucor mucedo]|uniref:fungal-specific transcription factor domain-containing protein n=1 Tax=Mucor mucedo TaxID=29922 RepID=UPI00221F3A73|nr:fungal-specific transcription factor domain-containing protein [Mucor mucedo]KAI7890166.1 fungal-specific transcription factor domain-containing protein [Mucor mucedo]
MSSVFVPESSGSPQQQKQPEQARPKRPRSSLACIRCRKKKVKCDFVQPTCGRCAIAGLPCSYATPPRRVDGHAFDQLGNHVEELKERMQKMQNELAMMKHNLHPFPPANVSHEDDCSNQSTPLMTSDNGNMALTSTSGVSEQSVTWKLSLSPSGLRIDTNIASVADLYRILLNGISQLNINNDSTTSLFNPESSSSSSNTIHNAFTSRDRRQQSNTPTSAAASAAAGNRRVNSGGGNYLDNDSEKSGRLWEVDEVEARKIQQEKKSTEDVLPKEVLDKLMHSCYNTCFLAYQIVDKDAFINQYLSEEGLDPLLANSINAWVSKHGCIYHNINGPVINTSMGEVYFKNARQLLKKCFDISSPTTIHALLNLYMYQLSSERSSLAYLYIGLAIRMAQDLKFHKKEHMSADLNQRETNKRLWWSAYWLDLCAALESNRPTMVDDKDCDLDYPVRLDHEDDETGYRIHFAVYSIKLMRIRKDITKHLPSEQSGQSLLSAISRLENALTNWLGELPLDLHFDDNSNAFQKTGSFRDEACLILNIQYQTTWIMLHKFFLPKQDQTATPVALLSLNICTKSASLITRMLSIYASNLNWCQFFYAMDGIIASVTIHQVNALSSEKEVSYLAQRNLIITASVLKKSPLMYMVKVCEIIESIEGFLKKNGLSADISDLPAVNEDSINQPSISSVFHPEHHHRPSYNSGSLSPSVQSQHTPGMMNSPQSQHSSSTIRVPSQLSSNMFQQQQTPQPSSASAVAAAAGQQPLHKQQQLHQQQQQHPSSNNSSMYNNPNMLVEPTMLFNDPGLMGFNMAPGAQGAGMDHLLLRDMGFDLNSPGSHPTGNDRLYMYDHGGNRSTTSNTSNSNSNYVSSTAASSAPYATSETTTNNFGYNTTASSNNNFNSSDNTSNTSANNNNTASYPFLNNAEIFGIPTASASPQPYPTNNQGGPFDPNNLFGSMNMDPATMSALLYNNPGMPNFSSYQQPQQPGTEDNDLLYGPNNGRKRVHRDWEDAS